MADVPGAPAAEPTGTPRPGPRQVHRGRRLPFGVTAALAAGPCGFVIFGFDSLEGELGPALGIDGGPAALVLVLVVFAFAWVLGGVLLAAFSPSPAREGLLAGAIVAAVIAAILVLIALEEGDVVIAALLAPIFCGLALGLGALAGNLAQRAMGSLGGSGLDQARPRPSRAAAIASFACGLLIVLLSIAVMGPLGLDPRTPLGLAVWGFGGVLMAGGLWGLARSRARPGEEST